MSMEKCFTIIFFICLGISSITFLLYDYVSEEMKKWIMFMNAIFALLIGVMMVLHKLFYKTK